MIIPDDRDAKRAVDPPQQLLSPLDAHAYDLELQAGPSSGLEAAVSPPSFEESVVPGHLEFEASHPETSAPDDAPPDFTPYAAAYWTDGASVISHDPHLNDDGEALYRFLLSQAASPPAFKLHCRGTHEETHTRLVSRTDKHGRPSQHTETETATVVDFDFSIDARPHVVGPPVHWSVADGEPAYRGQMVREVDASGLGMRRRATRDECRQFKAWVGERKARGLPPWVEQGASSAGPAEMSEHTRVLRSSRTLRQWADDYCASPKKLKEFTYEKEVYGWNLDSLEAAVRATIASTRYRGTVRVQFHVGDNTGPNKIVIRHDNTLARMLSNRFLKVLSMVLLIYPFIWLFRRFHSLGGGRWEVCGGAYALKRWEDGPKVKSDESADAVASRRETGGSDGSGAPRLLGLREGVWFKQWEKTIKRAVKEKYQSKKPLIRPDGSVVPEALALDGYLHSLYIYALFSRCTISPQ